MSELFLKIVNMSISASWLVLVVFVLRLVLNKAPKWVNVLLWGIVAVRLICPFSIESAFSLIPSAETISPNIMMDPVPTIHSGIPALNSVVNPIIGDSFAPVPGDSANPLQIWIPILAAVWLVGTVVFLLYTAFSYWRLRSRIGEAVVLFDNIYQSENVESPFVLGIIKPKIYLPYHINAQDLEHVVAHERAHIRRRDHWWKPLGFLLLAIHWFNPLMWVAYILLCRDIELACDEKVIREMGNEQRADYMQALVTCSINRHAVAACPLAFGEVGVKERVKSVMNYRKPAFWVIVASIVACAAVAVCFLTNPVNAIKGEYRIEGYGIYNNGAEYYIIVNDGVELKCTKEQYEQVTALMERFRTGEIEDTPVSVTYRQFLISYKRGTVIELEIPKAEVAGKTYVYEKEGIIGSFTITLYNDGTFSYYEGMASSYLGNGTWKQEGDTITMTDDGHGGYGLINHFKLDGDDLAFVEQDSANFVYVKVKDGEKFYRTGEAFKARDDEAGMEQSSVKQNLTLDDLLVLSQKGKSLTWSDFDDYSYIETGSGLYIRIYEIDEQFHLAIGGVPNKTPMYIYLGVTGDDSEARIDIRDGGVAEFIYGHKDGAVEFSGVLHLGLNAEVVDIDRERKILYVKDIDKSENIFGDRCAIDCGYAISRFDLLYVDYSNGDVSTIEFSDFEVGDAVIIGMYDSELQEAFNGSAVAKQIQLSTQRFSSETAFELNFAGNTSLHQKMELTAEKPHWRICVVNRGSDGINVDVAGDVYRIEPETSGNICPDEVFSSGTYTIGFSTSGAAGMEGYAICEVSPIEFAEEEPLALRLMDDPIVSVT